MQQEAGKPLRPRSPSSCSTAPEEESSSSVAPGSTEDSAYGTEEESMVIREPESSERMAKTALPGFGGAAVKVLMPQPERQGCGVSCLLDLMCSRFFKSDLVEYNLHSLEKVDELGYGAFGRVSLVWCHKTQQPLALKAMSKCLLTERKLQHATRSEKMVMKRLDSPFLTKLAATFADDQHLYILMEASRGGDLHTIYMNHDFFGSEEHARFYSACLVLAVDYLHTNRIIYRDLKMENIVMGANGYIKLCDFGLSRFLWPTIGFAYTICGTPEYKAPEIDSGTGYNHSADWWALGVLVYELMIGTTPFLAESATAIYEKACAGIDGVIPTTHNSVLAAFVRGLCHQEPNMRLPRLSGGMNNVWDHPWFQQPSLDWESLGCLRVTPPYTPQLEGPVDVGHFIVKDNFGPKDVAYRDTRSGWYDDYEDPMGPRCV